MQLLSISGRPPRARVAQPRRWRGRARGAGQVGTGRAVRTPEAHGGDIGVEELELAERVGRMEHGDRHAGRVELVDPATWSRWIKRGRQQCRIHVRYFDGARGRLLKGLAHEGTSESQHEPKASGALHKGSLAPAGVALDRSAHASVGPCGAPISVQRAGVQRATTHVRAAAASSMQRPTERIGACARLNAVESVMPPAPHTTSVWSPCTRCCDEWSWPDA
jgi:hypothetical protein